MGALSAWVSVETEPLDAAEVRTYYQSGSPGVVAAWEVDGLAHQTYHVDPVEVAAAYRRLADRIDAAMAEFNRLDELPLTEKLRMEEAAR